MKLLGLCGNLQRRSPEKQLLQLAAAACAPPDEFSLSAWIGALPHFNVEFEQGEIVPVVDVWRRQVSEATGLLLVTPSWLDGIPGSLKNALEWLRVGDLLREKPVALIQTRRSPAEGSACLDALSNSLRYSEARVVYADVVTVSWELGAGPSAPLPAEVGLAVRALGG